MSSPHWRSQNSSTIDVDHNLQTDVLVIGGGPAGTWAAWSAASAGAKVVLVDKGYCGTSGCAAASGNGVWYVPPDAEAREAAKASREALGGFLANRTWMDRVLDQTYTNVNLLAEWGYPFPVDEEGKPYRRSLQGPEYMRLMRKQIKRVGVTILDNSPALQLLVDAKGAVAGATGINRQTGKQWVVRAGGVIIATGGCAFLSKALGCNVLTGDGYLMAAEAGAEMSGMEFSNAYGISPAFSSVTKTLFYSWATFTYEDGTPISGAGSQRGRSVIAQTLLTQPVYAILDKANEEMQANMRKAQPNFFLPFDRAGIDPFNQRFLVTLRLEGTVRGTGGIRIVDSSCAASVPGLYAAGDAATRELICGGFTGGGSHNAAWAISSGYWAGKSAAEYAQSLGEGVTQRPVEAVGEAGLISGSQHQIKAEEVIQATQAEVFPYDRNLFRTEQTLTGSLQRLDHLWQEIRSSQAGNQQNIIQMREAAAMVATARWMYNSALERKETRGMHKHLDFPEMDVHQQHYLVSGGLDRVWVRREELGIEKELVGASS
ncbi:fumarate reductase/succinate dehydrogenase flavoprotein domain-containing protein [Tolypothrix tenuis PCC 7101]|uniref:Fumarate reductase/succinate dehydrogenase flavoprotein domain-containing protein n=1 Tax=Tolypothrix tenuis PCC 7101 TaxID=231146 RepID=A0A1Z4MRY9_9CYAN|nr:FAD-binding protein [Aulosira sp. FACHB-113]BAY96240.1 fumarate reductase/succinate dehydrogenase flavoprotein domain-containing protein [Tolypothrix tenuis PCC 7101]BAZ73253.1 fumarate reductase/succinate dehydrogenase flavoprotein domain-containing protein [Aulosira laxa NIES-50]